MPAESETVPCIWCAKPTRMLGTRQCDNCWELSRRIRYDLDLTRQILRVEHDIETVKVRTRSNGATATRKNG